MLRPTIKITIGSLSFDYVTQYNQVSGWDDLTDTATIILPNNFIKEGATIIIGDNNVFKRGDAVTIEAGYYPNSEEIFQGYVSKVTPGVTVEIGCEDASWLLKQSTITLSFESIDLKGLIVAMLNQAENGVTGTQKTVIQNIIRTAEIVAAELGQFRISNATVAQVFEELKKVYGIITFFQGGILKSGLAYNATGVQHIFDFEYLGREDFIETGAIIEDDLEYRREDDIRIKVKAISMLPDNTKIEVEVGDADGETRTLNFYNLTETELRKHAENHLPNLKYEGYAGKFKAFGEPKVEHGDEIKFKNLKVAEREDNISYLVASVEKEFGVETGYKQIIELGRKV